jgi:excisionase family DNA binding protein
VERLLLRVEEAAERTGLSRSKGYELVATGDWPSVKVGRSRRVPLASLMAWINRELERSVRIDSAGSNDSAEANVAGPAITAMTMGGAATGSVNRRARTTTKPDGSVTGDDDD